MDKSMQEDKVVIDTEHSVIQERDEKSSVNVSPIMAKRKT